jgi:hypothetical protein
VPILPLTLLAGGCVVLGLHGLILHHSIFFACASFAGRFRTILVFGLIHKSVD